MYGNIVSIRAAQYIVIVSLSRYHHTQYEYREFKQYRDISPGQNTAHIVDLIAYIAYIVVHIAHIVAHIVAFCLFYTIEYQNNKWGTQ